MDQEKNLPIPKELVESELLALTPVFRRLRYQLQTGHGALGKIDSDIEEKDDPNEVLALEIFNRYKQSLLDNKQAEIEKFFFGNEVEYSETVKALSDPLRFKILLGFYYIDEKTNWRRACDAINSRQTYKNDGFPRTETINELMSVVNNSQQ